MVLSKREFEVSKLLTLGYIAKEIAENLFISTRTVETHKKNVFKKNKGIKNTADIVREFVVNFGSPKNVINVNLGNMTGATTYSLSTIDGKMIGSKNTTNNKIFTVDLTNKADGIYLLKISNESSIETIKVIKR